MHLFFFFLFSGWSAFDAFLVRFGVIWHNVVLLFFLFSRLALRAVMFLYIEWLRERDINARSDCPLAYCGIYSGSGMGAVSFGGLHSL